MGATREEEMAMSRGQRLRRGRVYMRWQQGEAINVLGFAIHGLTDGSFSNIPIIFSARTGDCWTGSEPPFTFEEVSAKLYCMSVPL